MNGTFWGNLLLIIIAIVGWIVLSVPFAVLIGKWLKGRQ